MSNQLRRAAIAAGLSGSLLLLAAGSASATLETAAHNGSSSNNAASATTGALGISNATQSHKTWREPRHPKLVILAKKRPPVGTTFSFTLGGPATVRFDFTQRVPGRRVHGKCVASTKRNAHKRKCTRTVSRGSFSFESHAGRDAVRFEGRVGSGTLKPGRYTLVITAITPGLGPTSARLTFTIVR